MIFFSTFLPSFSNYFGLLFVTSLFVVVSHILYISFNKHVVDALLYPTIAAQEPVSGSSAEAAGANNSPGNQQ